MTPAELNALAEAATPGPWEIDAVNERVYRDTGDPSYPDGVADVCFPPDGNGDKDAALIALTPDLARLVAEMGEALEDLSAEGWFASWSDDPRVVEIRAALAKLSELEAR